MEREQFFVGVGLSSYTATGVLHRGLWGITGDYWAVTEAYWSVTEAYWGEKGGAPSPSLQIVILVSGIASIPSPT